MPARKSPVSRDRLSKEQRSWNMSRIRGKDTKPELLVRRLLHAMGVQPTPWYFGPNGTLTPLVRDARL